MDGLGGRGEFRFRFAGVYACGSCGAVAGGGGRVDDGHVRRSHRGGGAFLQVTPGHSPRFLGSLSFSE